MKSNTTKLVRSALFLAIALAFQAIGQSYAYINQFFVGPIVNAVLILTVILCGGFWAAGVGALTPILAYATGIIQPPMAPFIPFIMLGNIIFIAFFAIIKNYKNFGKYLGVIFGALFKYAFLSFSVTKLIHVFNLGFKPAVAKKLAQTMSTPQLFTALAGGALALIIAGLLRRRKLI